MKLIPIDQGNAWQVVDTDITNLTTEDYLQIRQWLMEKLIIVFKNQPADTYHYGRLVHGIGYGKKGPGSERSIANQHNCFWNGLGEPIFKYCVRGADGKMAIGKLADGPLKWPYAWPEDYADRPLDFPIQRVTGQTDKDEIPQGIFGKGELLWHSNINDIRFPDGVALQGYEGCENTSTQFLNTARCRADMDKDLLKALHTAYGEYRMHAEGWGPGIDKLQRSAMMLHAGQFRAWVLQTNRAGTEGIFFNPLNNAKLFGDVDDLWNTVYDHYFDKEYFYEHWWEPGDIVLMDQLLTLHQRGQHDPEMLKRRVLHRYEFIISNYDNWMQRENIIIPGRISRPQ